MVGDSDRGEDALDDGGDGGVGVALNSGISEVSTKKVGLDDGAVMGRSTDEGGWWLGRRKHWRQPRKPRGRRS